MMELFSTSPEIVETSVGESDSEVPLSELFTNDHSGIRLSKMTNKLHQIANRLHSDNALEANESTRFERVQLEDTIRYACTILNEAWAVKNNSQ